MRFILPDSAAGHAAKRMLQYKLSEKGRVAEFFVESRVEIKKKDKKDKRKQGVPMQTIVIEAKGKTYADLLRRSA